MTTENALFSDVTKLPPLAELGELLLKDQALGEIEGVPLYLACSGGLDSMVLFHLVAALPNLRSRLTLLHVNYGLRGEESDADEAFVRAEAERVGVNCEVLRAPPAPVNGIQDWARQIRYEWFAERAGAEGLILLGHHRDDLIETILMRVVRGSHGFALQGMRPRQGSLLRPLLRITREILIEIARREKIKHREDSSNAKLDYSRNRIRALILPELESMFPGAGQNLLELGRASSQWADCLKKWRPELPQTSSGWRELGFYPSGSLLRSYLEEQGIVNVPGRRWLETVYEKLCDGTEGAVQGEYSWQLRLNAGCVQLETRAAAHGARWQQYQAALSREEPLMELAPGTVWEPNTAKRSDKKT